MAPSYPESGRDGILTIAETVLMKLSFSHLHPSSRFHAAIKKKPRARKPMHPRFKGRGELLRMALAGIHSSLIRACEATRDVSKRGGPLGPSRGLGKNLWGPRAVIYSFLVRITLLVRVHYPMLGWRKFVSKVFVFDCIRDL